MNIDRRQNPERRAKEIVGRPPAMYESVLDDYDETGP